MPFAPPPHALGADLFWWREREGLHTLVTIYWREYADLPDAVHLHCVLFDAAGMPCGAWDIPVRPGGLAVIDSPRLDAWLTDPPAIGEGILAVYTCTADPPSEEARAEYRRLYSMIDWYADDGSLCALHNDQSVVRGREKAIGLTEIVVREMAEARHALVFLTGEDAQPPEALTLQVMNSRGEIRTASYTVGMNPFTVHVLRLGELFPGFLEFGAGEHVTVSGTFQMTGLYVRPYVITEGARLSAYHGGDVYHWAPLPAVHYKLLSGGEINPMAVLHRPGTLETTVNLFNTHGDLTEDFWVDAELYDEEGTRVARRERWRCARRDRLERGDLTNLLPDPSQPFTGHIALSFSSADVPAYPRHLQALLEYASPGTIARVMAWSDEWNSPPKLFRRTRDGAPPLRSYYRVWSRPDFTTWLSITNAGHGAYRERAPYIVRLRNATGEELTVSGELAPRATRFASIDQLFPEAAVFLTPWGIGVVEIESPCDLANIQFVEHAGSGVWSAEHFMAATTHVAGQSVVPAGA